MSPGGDTPQHATPSLPAVFWELHEGLRRQGPGGDRHTRRAFAALRLPFGPGSLDLIWSEGAIYIFYVLQRDEGDGSFSPVLQVRWHSSADADAGVSLHTEVRRRPRRSQAWALMGDSGHEENLRRRPTRRSSRFRQRHGR